MRGRSLRIFDYYNSLFEPSFEGGYGRPARKIAGAEGSSRRRGEVHGGCKSVGCYAMTDYAMGEIYGLVDEAFRGGQEKVQLEAFPFRMTTQSLARHADNSNTPFWEMLKTGSDAFLATGRPPTVAVCDQRYVFNPAITDKDCDPSKEEANTSRLMYRAGGFGLQPMWRRARLGRSTVRDKSGSLH